MRVRIDTAALVVIFLLVMLLSLTRISRVGSSQHRAAPVAAPEPESSPEPTLEERLVGAKSVAEYVEIKYGNGKG